MIDNNTSKLIDAVNKTLSFYHDIPETIYNSIKQAKITSDCRCLLYKVEQLIKEKKQILKKNQNQKGGKSKMAEKNEEKVNNPEETELSFQILRGNLSFRHRLKEFEDEVVVVEFDCGKFLKKAMGILKHTGCDFLELTGTHRNLVIVDILSINGIIDTEKALKAVIPLDRVCSVELISKCPPGKRHPFNENEGE